MDKALERIILIFELLAGVAVILFFSGTALRWGQLRGLGLPADLGVAWATSATVSVKGAAYSFVVVAAFTTLAIGLVAIGEHEKVRTHTKTRRIAIGVFALVVLAIASLTRGDGLGVPSAAGAVVVLLAIVVAASTELRRSATGAAQAKEGPNRAAIVAVVAVTGSVAALIMQVGIEFDTASPLPKVSYISKNGKCHEAYFVGEAGDQWVFADGPEKKLYYMLENRDDRDCCIGR